ncbi:hypothetical protein MLD38_009295 [Melastoma candidum]|uniref:Uncharacterized protein n=1 Tax=Melastoma candidum TaxID=119954 RepID=A0ACB9RW88_9MYRT|nr:hypothetical protein MLD38_009295 [Melastoma candidum]
MDQFGNEYGFYLPSSSSSYSTSNSRMISFGSSGSPQFDEGDPPVNEPKNEVKRTRSSPEEHVIAERKRRERLTQRIVALSAIIPGLRKMDKASILEDAIKYLKELQERVRILEEEATRRARGSPLIVRSSNLGMDDFVSSNEEDIGNLIGEQYPEIEARISENYVLVRVHFEMNQYGVPKIMAEIEKLNLNIINSNVLPFGSSSFDLTAVALMKPEFRMTVKDVVDNLRQALIPPS